MNAPLPTVQKDQGDLITVLENSLYPGASRTSIALAIEYCEQAGLDPIQKPVHIVPMWDSKSSRMRDVIMPGIGLYRTMAARTNLFAGMSEPEFGPDVQETIGGAAVTYPAWCRVVAKRRLPTGEIAEFVAVERWKENYAVKGGKEKSIAPNAMWQKRPYGQLAKCTEAQALRKAFPEFGAQPTAEEMVGRTIHEDDATPAPTVEMPKSRAERAEPVDAEIVAEAAPAEPAASDEPSPPASANALRMLRAKLDQNEKSAADLCEHFGIEDLTALPMAKINDALAWAKA